MFGFWFESRFLQEEKVQYRKYNNDNKFMTER